MSDSESVQLGPLIRRFRLSSGMSQEQLAEKSGLSARAVSDLERGLRTGTRPETLRMLAEGLALTSDERETLLLAARPGLRGPMPDVPGGLATGNRWPAPQSQLVGREELVSGVVGLLQQGSRLVTLTGPGGVGKTRVALEAGLAAAQSAGWEAYFVDLSPTTRQNQVESTITMALGLREVADRSMRSALEQGLLKRRALLLLDNFEQAMDAAPLVRSLLDGAPDLRVLVTSREALRIQNEVEVAIDPLGLPGAADGVHFDNLSDFAAIALFVARAQAVRPEFALSQENAAAIAEICRRLDGLPLAIELAASLVRHFPPELILSRMERRLPVLTGGSRDAPARQRTLRDTIGWSYDLLTPEEQTLFRRIGAFPGGATLDSLDCFARVAGDMQIDLLSGLASLVDKNLVRETVGAAGTPRFSMFETIREFSADMIADAGEAQSCQHAVVAWALDIVDHAREGVYGWFVGPKSPREMDDEIENYRLACDIAADRADAETLTRLFVGIGGYLYQRGLFREAIDRGAQATVLAQTGAISERMRGILLVETVGFLVNNVDDVAEAEALAREGVSLIQAGRGDEADTLQGLNALSMAIREQGRYAEALGYAMKADVLAQTPRGSTFRGLTAFSIGKLLYLMGDQDGATERLSQSMRLSLESEAVEFAIHAGCYLSVAQLRHDQPMAAAATLRDVVHLWRKSESSGTIPFLVISAILAASENLPESAARLFAATSAQNAIFGISDETDHWTIGAYEKVSEQLGRQRLEDARGIGGQLSREEAVTLVLEVLDQIESQTSNPTGKRN